MTSEEVVELVDGPIVHALDGVEMLAEEPVRARFLVEELGVRS